MKNGEILKKNIHKLVDKYPGKFELLEQAQFECSNDVEIIAYNHTEHVILYNKKICEDDNIQYLRCSLAFIGTLMSEEQYYKAPHGLDRTLYNMAVQLKIMSTLSDAIKFNNWPNVLDYEVDTSGKVIDIYNELIADKCVMGFMIDDEQE